MSLDISALSDRFTVRRLTQTFPPCMKLTRNNINATPRAAERSVLGKERFYQSRRSVHQRLFRLSVDGAVNLSKGEYHASYLPKGRGIRY